MGKFDRFENLQTMKQKDRGVHPIWRGIGCVMLILIPIVAFAAADTFYGDDSISKLLDVRRSGELYRILFSFKLPGEVITVTPFHLVFTLLFSIIGFMIFSLIYAVVYRVAGPPKYGPTDAPPPKRRSKRRSR